jgi:hypothetical protein
MFLPLILAASTLFSSGHNTIFDNAVVITETINAYYYTQAGEFGKTDTTDTRSIVRNYVGGVTQPACSGMRYKSAAGYEWVVTASHCLEPEIVTDFAGTIEGIMDIIPDYVTYSNGERAKVVEAYYDSYYDVGFMKVYPTRSRPRVNYDVKGSMLPPSEFLLGTRIESVGNTQGLGFVFMEGKIIGGRYLGPQGIEDPSPQPVTWDEATRKQINRTYLMSSLEAYPGASGSAWLTDDGKFTGILVAGQNTIDLFVSAQDTRNAFLRAFTIHDPILYSNWYVPNPAPIGPYVDIDTLLEE